MSWTKYKFSDLIDINPKVLLNKGEEYNFIPMEDINPEYKNVYPSKKRKISSSGSRFCENDVIFARITPCLEHGKIAFISKLETNGAFGSTEYFVFRPKDSTIDNHYLYYLAKSEIIRSPAIKSMVGSSGRQRAQKSIIANIEIPLPPLSTQKRIAGILSAYDDFIENNNRRITLLEQSAHLLYKEWFVKFKFPGHEKVKIVDGVPEGWERRTLGSILEHVSRLVKIKKSEYTTEGQYPCIDQSQNFIGGFTNNKNAVYFNNIPIVIFGDHTRCVKYIDFEFACGADGTQLLKSSYNGITTQYLYFMVLTIDLSNFFYARHFKFLKASDILVPKQHLISLFTEKVQENMKQISVLRKYNLKLAKARDLLLPRLIHGDIQV